MVYNGPDLETIHAGFNIDHKEFDLMANMASEVCLEMGMRPTEIVKVRVVFDSNRSKVVNK